MLDALVVAERGEVEGRVVDLVGDDGELPVAVADLRAGDGDEPHVAPISSLHAVGDFLVGGRFHHMRVVA
ncbi:hypothetical protein, partial [Pseudonocardia charpentierae]